MFKASRMGSLKVISSLQSANISLLLLQLYGLGWLGFVSGFFGFSTGVFPFTTERGEDGYPAGYGGSFFHDDLGMLLRPTGIGTSVYWQFISGTLKIDSVEYKKSSAKTFRESDYSVTGTVDAIAQRRFYGP